MRERLELWQCAEIAEKACHLMWITESDECCSELVEAPDRLHDMFGNTRRYGRIAAHIYHDSMLAC